MVYEYNIDEETEIRSELSELEMCAIKKIHNYKYNTWR